MNFTYTQKPEPSYTLVDDDFTMVANDYPPEQAMNSAYNDLLYVLEMERKGQCKLSPAEQIAYVHAIAFLADRLGVMSIKEMIEVR